MWHRVHVTDPNDESGVCAVVGRVDVETECVEDKWGWVESATQDWVGATWLIDIVY